MFDYLLFWPSIELLPDLDKEKAFFRIILLMKKIVKEFFVVHTQGVSESDIKRERECIILSKQSLT